MFRHLRSEECVSEMAAFMASGSQAPREIYTVHLSEMGWDAMIGGVRGGDSGRIQDDAYEVWNDSRLQTSF